MAVLNAGLSIYPYAAELRRELSLRNLRFARQHKLPHRESYGQPPVTCYQPSEDNASHGNFLHDTYRAILQNPDWARRLGKVHTQIRGSADRRWRELDSCNSSDALLMNIFCNPKVLQSRQTFDLLGVEAAGFPEFGVKARVPLVNGRFDRTEIDMRLEDLLVEAKLTESDFQSCGEDPLQQYRDFREVFGVDELPRNRDRILSYQLIRNVLAAHASASSFCVISDERRPDLKEAWYAVMRTIRIANLRVRCKIITWQELSEGLPRKLRTFLAEKYGIAAGDMTPAPCEASAAEFA